jgi:hypothetical protein
MLDAWSLTCTTTKSDEQQYDIPDATVWRTKPKMSLMRFQAPLVLYTTTCVAQGKELFTSHASVHTTTGVTAAAYVPP